MKQYNVLLVDDEQSHIESLKLSIKWDVLHLAYAGSAHNGYEALTIIDDGNIDIVITDIRMPDMSGLELCRCITELYPSIQIIIISAFADFRYAQEAIRYHVLGYCLKPVQYQDIHALLKKAVANIVTDSGRNDIFEALEENDFAVMQRLLEEKGITDSAFYILMCAGAKKALPFLQHQPYLKMGTALYLYFSAQPFRAKELQEEADRYTERIGIGYQTAPVTVETLKENINTVFTRAYQFFIAGKTLVCDTAVDPEHSHEYLKSVTGAIQENNKKGVITELSRLLMQPMPPPVTIKHAFQLYNTVSSGALRKAETDDLYIYSIGQLVSTYASFSDMVEELIDLLLYKETDDNTVSSNATFMNIIKYLGTYFTDDISLKTIADYLKMNPNYIGALFKRETGETFTNYLTKLRIDRAKELLLTTDMSISEICTASGFNDYFYFIKTFKKITGTTPGKFE